ncbi:DUF742 domain-containing protein [Amycolatopsis anabasis]|uniref:DUF742 domain-containing protein n=1 Tax=Amycolatopsis anabasis TaxID=1840409 RepID=UPI00131A935C|nr:DUF742 domain-containing protein [Amycolatopsis anabasis]
MTPRRDYEDDSWETLHRGADRDLDSPARFDLPRSPALVDARAPLPGRSAMRPSPVPRSMVRPYARTGGRTRPDYELAIEALVSTTQQGRLYQGAVSVEHRIICDLCTESKSVAEIAAHLGLPLGVVKVIVSDMDNAGLVLIHQPGLMFGDRSSREFMERVLAGLRSL